MAVPQFQLTVNGRSQGVEVGGEVPLLWVLRDVLGLTGTKFGCGVGLCGACTVHLDGQAVRSCLVPIAAVGARAVTTIEGFTEHPVVAAFVAEQAPQCGYCQPGQVMAMIASHHGAGSGSDALLGVQAGNLCRCGTYLRIRAAARRLAGEG